MYLKWDLRKTTLNNLYWVLLSNLNVQYSQNLYFNFANKIFRNDVLNEILFS